LNEEFDRKHYVENKKIATPLDYTKKVLIKKLLIKMISERGLGSGLGSTPTKKAYTAVLVKDDERIEAAKVL
jgi:hypothetical protein